MKQFSEAPYYEEYKRIRNKFRKLDSISIINGCLRYLHSPVKDEFEQLKKQPWHVLLLIKWILLDKDFYIKNRKLASDSETLKIMQSVLDLGGKARMPSQYQHHILFFRNVAYQQFLYQKRFSLSNFFRQFILFYDLPDNHVVKVAFFESFGISLNKFLELSIIILVRFLDEKYYTISSNYFNSLKNGYSKYEINNFLLALSKTLTEIKNWLIENDSGKRYASEYYEQTPFLEYPLLKDNENYICIEKHIFFRGLEHFIYDKLRDWNSAKFMDKFGGIFENYVETTIKHTKLLYFDEEKLKKLIPESKKVIDFIIVDNNSNIFLDAKAVEMSYTGKVTYLTDVVKDKTKLSILKAIEQAHDVLSKLKKHGGNGESLNYKEKNYLIVVTFKELYLGSGRTFYETIAKDKIDEIYYKYKNDVLIDLDNIFFLTIEEFELFSEAIHAGNISLVEGLEKAKLDDLQPETRKFDFLLHILGWGFPIDTPSYLRDRSDLEFDKFATLLKQND